MTIHFRARAKDGSWEEGEDGQAYVIWNPTHKWGRRGIEIRRGVGVLPPKEEKEAEREQLDFHFVRLGGRRARALERPIAHPAGPQLTVDCEYLPSVELAVFDGPGQVHAKGLVLVEAAQFEEWDHFQVPIHWAGSGLSKPIGSDLASPITLEDRDGRITYFVRSKTSAWSRITLDHETPGRRSVHLRPGGRVEFTVLASAIRPDTRLRIYEVGDGPGSAFRATTFCTLTSEGRSFIDGLRVGTWEVRAELGTASYGNPSLGSGIFQVSAGATTQVNLTLQDPPAPRTPVPVRGEIVFSEPIDNAPCLRGIRFSLSLDAVDPWAPEFGSMRFLNRLTMAADPVNPNKLLWDAGKLTPGPWTAEIRSADWCDTWNIEADRENYFSIDLTHLLTLRLQVVERDSRAPVRIRRVEFRRASAPGCKTLGGSAEADPGDPMGVLTMQVPEGAYELEFAPWKGEDRCTLYLPSIIQPNGFLEVEYSETKPSSVALELRSSGMNIPLPMSWLRKIEFIREDGQRIQVGRSSSGGNGNGSDAARAEFELDAEGAIEIRFPALEEFLEIPPATVELVAGEMTQLEIELVPIP